MIKNIEERTDCPMRNKNSGNCMVVGGFCMDAVSDEICHVIHQAYKAGREAGRYDALNTLAKKRTPIEGLEWILKDDRFGFGEGWSENELPRCEEEWAGYYIERAIEALKQYQKADSVLNAHGFVWNNAEKQKT